MLKKDLSIHDLSDDSKKHDYYCSMYEMKFSTPRQCDQHVKLGKYEKKLKEVQHSIRLLLQLSLNNQVLLSSRYVRIANNFDNKNLCIDTSREELK